MEAEYRNNLNDKADPEDKEVDVCPPLPCAKCNVFPLVKVSKVAKVGSLVAEEIGRLECPECEVSSKPHVKYREMFKEWNYLYA